MQIDIFLQNCYTGHFFYDNVSHILPLWIICLFLSGNILYPFCRSTDTYTSYSVEEIQAPVSPYPTQYIPLSVLSSPEKDWVFVLYKFMSLIAKHYLEPQHCFLFRKEQNFILNTPAVGTILFHRQGKWNASSLNRVSSYICLMYHFHSICLSFLHKLKS